MKKSKKYDRMSFVVYPNLHWKLCTFYACRWFTETNHHSPTFFPPSYAIDGQRKTPRHQREFVIHVHCNLFTRWTFSYKLDYNFFLSFREKELRKSFCRFPTYFVFTLRFQEDECDGLDDWAAVAALPTKKNVRGFRWWNFWKHSSNQLFLSRNYIRHKESKIKIGFFLSYFATNKTEEKNDKKDKRWIKKTDIKDGLRH
jgi:hypothetical protein